MKDISEKQISKKLGGKLTVASGAVHNDADIRFDDFLAESKRRTGAKKITMLKAVWEKLRKQAVRTNRTPIYFFDNGIRKWAIMHNGDMHIALKWTPNVYNPIECKTKNLLIDPNEKGLIEEAYVDVKYNNSSFTVMEFNTFKNKYKEVKNGK